MANFTPENELETLFMDAYADAKRRPAFFRKFLEATIFVMDDPKGGDGGASAGPGIRMLEINGVAHIPAFSSVGRIGDFGHRAGQYHEVRTRALLESVRGFPLILNPGSSPTKIFSREDIVALLDGTLLVDR
jgi:hypothetical protein